MSSSRLGLRALDALLAPLRRMRLDETRFAFPATPPRADLPVLVAANHVSWWDGFLLREAHERLRPRQPFCIVMTERELSRRPWLRALGAVGIEPGSVSSVRRAFREAGHRRRDEPGSFFVYFPQGVIWPSSRRPLGFERGVALLARVLAPVSILPAAIHIEPLNRARPTPFLVLGEPLVVEPGDSVGASQLAGRVEQELDRLHTFLERHGENAIDAWPAWRRRPEPGMATRS
jgi:1-acyl-sn-glycerol-3-phosphate acyltransferase